jgi:hypothetical protein
MTSTTPVVDSGSTWTAFAPCIINSEGAGPFDFNNTTSSRTIVNSWFNGQNNRLDFPDYFAYNNFTSESGKQNWADISNIFTFPDFLNKTVTVHFKSGTTGNETIQKPPFTISRIFELITPQNYIATGESNSDPKIFFEHEIKSFPGLGVNEFANFELSGFIIHVMKNLDNSGSTVAEFKNQTFDDLLKTLRKTYVALLCKFHRLYAEFTRLLSETTATSTTDAQGNTVETQTSLFDSLDATSRGQLIAGLVRLNVAMMITNYLIYGVYLFLVEGRIKLFNQAQSLNELYTRNDSLAQLNRELTQLAQKKSAADARVEYEYQRRNVTQLRIGISAVILIVAIIATIFVVGFVGGADNSAAPAITTTDLQQGGGIIASFVKKMKKMVKSVAK